mmetsp:Transcript_14682/g.33381  ORF Transcript_14682/g.33381 Transcript_14682/m.33381 type:complete len:182 (-) Transcript_14682:142-687(-)
MVATYAVALVSTAYLALSCGPPWCHRTSVNHSVIIKLDMPHVPCHFIHRRYFPSNYIRLRATQQDRTTTAQGVCEYNLKQLLDFASLFCALGDITKHIDETPQDYLYGARSNVLDCFSYDKDVFNVCGRFDPQRDIGAKLKTANITAYVQSELYASSSTSTSSTTSASTSSEYFLERQSRA